MKFQVTEIEFDFEMEDDEYPSDDYQQALTDETIGQIWDADDEDDLVEEITCATGWCIKSIDYVTFLTNQMTDLRYSTGEELEQCLYEKCRQDPDLLATIINEYVCSLSDNKLIELEDFLTNNFGDN